MDRLVFPFKKIFMHGYLLASPNEKLSKSGLGANYDFSDYVRSLSKKYHPVSIRTYVLANPVDTGFIYDEACIKPFEQKIRIIINTISYLKNARKFAEDCEADAAFNYLQNRTDSGDFHRSDSSIGVALLLSSLKVVDAFSKALSGLFNQMKIQEYTLLVLKLVVEVISRNHLKLIKPFIAKDSRQAMLLEELVKKLESLLAPVVGTKSGVVPELSLIKPTKKVNLLTSLRKAWWRLTLNHSISVDRVSCKVSEVLTMRESIKLPLKVAALVPADLLTGYNKWEIRVIELATNVRAGAVVGICEDLTRKALTTYRYVSSYLNNTLKNRFNSIVIYADYTVSGEILRNAVQKLRKRYPAKAVSISDVPVDNMVQLAAGLYVLTT